MVNIDNGKQIDFQCVRGVTAWCVHNGVDDSFLVFFSRWVWCCLIDKDLNIHTVAHQFKAAVKLNGIQKWFSIFLLHLTETLIYIQYDNWSMFNICFNQILLLST